MSKRSSNNEWKNERKQQKKMLRQSDRYDDNPCAENTKKNTI